MVVAITDVLEKAADENKISFAFAGILFGNVYLTSREYLYHNNYFYSYYGYPEIVY